MSSTRDAGLSITERIRAARVIAFALMIVAAALVVLGLGYWQPWAEPRYQEVKNDDGVVVMMCVTYKDSVTCPR
ncbi:hypothetical protein [Nocardia sp. NPDC051570]|uniref:hypothetical protein n=1 Tax=Nocardia sp. NPDC051570 TaxID=3364324 RepID=UPI0037AF943A